MSTENPWNWDLRIRDRNLKAGTIEEKDVQKFLGELPDLEAQTESFSVFQPALDEPEEVFDDEDEDDEDDEEEEISAPAEA